MDATLSTAALATAEQLINRALAYDPGSRIALAQLEPQVLAVALSAPELTIYIAPAEEGIRLMGHWEGDITTRVQGSLPALAMLARSERINLKDSGVQIAGSTGFLADLQKILKNLDIDWEEMLSQVFGDIVGHQGAQAIRGQMNWVRDRGANLQRLLGEFLTEELRASPGKAEQAFFSAEVDQLALDLDRVQARLDALFARINPASPTEK